MTTPVRVRLRGGTRYGVNAFRRFDANLGPHAGVLSGETPESPEACPERARMTVKTLQDFVTEYGPDAGPKLYRTLRSRAAYKGVCTRRRRPIETLTGRPCRLRRRGPVAATGQADLPFPDPAPAGSVGACGSIGPDHAAPAQGLVARAAGGLSVRTAVRLPRVILTRDGTARRPVPPPSMTTS